MGEYKSNSHISRESETTHDPIPERRAEKVVSGEVRKSKPSGLSRLKAIFLPGDVKDVKEYVITDILIPSAKRIIREIGESCIDILTGDTNRSRRTPGAYVSYSRYSQPSSISRTQAAPAAISKGYDDIIFDTRGDAEIVLQNMEDLLDQFGVVSVADLYDLAGMTADYTMNKYGWTKLIGTKIDRLPDGGYIIRLPRATSIV